MPSKVQFKRSNVAGKIPLATDIDVGEVAINFVDRKMFTKEPGGNIVELGGAGAAVTWGTLTGKPATFPADWAGITGIPAAFPPAAHTHAWAAITGKPTLLALGNTGTTAAAGDHVHAWGDITGKPATFPAAWAAITGLPATFAPSAHQHAWGDITGKPTLLAIGTTATTAAAGNHTHAWAAITGKPATFTPATHTHAWASITGKPTIPTIGAGATNAAAGNHNHDTQYLKLSGGQLTGDLGIGVAPAKPLHVAGEIVATDDITAFYSDMRLKENITLFADPLGMLDQIDAFTYQPNSLARDIGAVEEDDFDWRVGVSAQDVEKVLPQAVKPAPFDLAEDGSSKSGEYYKTVQYEKLVPLLIAAIQELKQEIEELKHGH